MSAASCSRSGSAARARCSSRSGRRPAFQASTNSLRMRSGSGGTKDLLQFLDAATAALVDVVRGDVQALCDRVAVELVDVRELEGGAVVVVAHARDGPPHEALGVQAAGLVGDCLLGLRAAVGVVGGERGVVRTGLAVGLPRRVEAAGGVALVAQLLAPEVHARVVHRADHGGAELADLPLAESGAHRDEPQVRLRRGAAGLVGRQARSAGEAEAPAEQLDAVEVVLGQALPDLRRLCGPPAVAGEGVAAQQEMVGFVGHSRQGSRTARRSDSALCDHDHAGRRRECGYYDWQVACKLRPSVRRANRNAIRAVRSLRRPTRTRRCRRSFGPTGPRQTTETNRAPAAWPRAVNEVHVMTTLTKLRDKIERFDALKGWRMRWHMQ